MKDLDLCYLKLIVLRLWIEDRIDGGELSFEQFLQNVRNGFWIYTKRYRFDCHKSQTSWFPQEVEIQFKVCYGKPNRPLKISKQDLKKLILYYWDG